MKPSEITKGHFRKMKSGAIQAALIEIIRQQALGIDEDIEDHIGVSVTRVKVDNDEL